MMYPDYDAAPSPQPVYSAVDTVYAWLSLVLAFLFCQALPIAQYPLGGFLLILALYATGFIILRLKKLKLCPVCILSAVSSFVIGSSMLLTDTEFLMNLSLAYSLASYCYFLYAAFGNRIEEGFSDYIYIDFIKILFIFPFRSLGSIFQALSNRSTKRGSALLLKILIGIGIALVPTLLVFSFLSYDRGFTHILEDIFSFDFGNIERIFTSFLFTLPLGMYGFGLYRSSQEKVLKDRMTAQNCKEGLKKAQILPQSTALVAVFPVIFLYVVYFISQWRYYVSGFTGVLPEEFSYAEYARQGFFELCSVSVVNLVLIIGISFFIKRGKKESSVILKIITTLFCLCTLILIATAVSKLVMYIDFYGLTQKRIYALWLMVVIGIVFLVIALGQFLRNLKVVAVSLTVTVLLFSALSVCNVNALCARYNTDRYLSGSLESFDLEAMEELGDSAIPSLVRLSNSLDSEKDSELKRQIDALLVLEKWRFKNEDASVFSFSVPSAMAKAALEDYVVNAANPD
ncbi:MAG: DUF4173 domain-containing protein [Ruminococcaceae bacterium]|nr:DUF4173 domain-containing protein [Oscillospiraceae bacterium]